MATGRQSCYEGSSVENFNVFLEESKQHQFITAHIREILRPEFEKMGAGKNSLNVLGVGSGGGQMDVELLSLLQSVCPDVPITADIVEGSTQLVDNFKALVANTSNLQKTPFTWHVMRTEDYQKQVEAKDDVKKFDFIHMIHMLYYVDDINEMLKFHCRLLKENSRLLIIITTATSAWVALNKKLNQMELSTGSNAEKSKYKSEYIPAFLKSQGLKYEEKIIPFSIDITECFNPSSTTGDRLLSFLTSKEHVDRSFTPEVRATILDFLRDKCSTVKDGRVLFDSSFSWILVYT